MKNILKFLFIIIGLNFYAQVGSVGIGTSSPHSSAILDLVSNNKGMIIPQFSLNQNNISDYSFLAVQPTKSLLIYNTNSGFPGGKGLYYWDGTKWIFYFNSANINLLLGITKYYSKNYTGFSSNTYNSESGSVGSFVNGTALTAPWIQVSDPTPFTFLIDRVKNNTVITFTGMLQLNNTSAGTANLNFGLGIFVDNKLISSKSASLVADNTCAFQEFTMTGLVDDLTVGNHTITLAVMNRSANTTASVHYGQKASSCTSISNDEAKISAVVLINQPLPY